MPGTQVNNVGFDFVGDDGNHYDVLGNFYVEWYEEDDTGRLVIDYIDLESGTVNEDAYSPAEFQEFVADNYTQIQDAAWSEVYSRLRSLLLP